MLFIYQLIKRFKYLLTSTLVASTYFLGLMSKAWELHNRLLLNSASHRDLTDDPSMLRRVSPSCRHAADGQAGNWGFIAPWYTGCQGLRAYSPCNNRTRTNNLPHPSIHSSSGGSGDFNIQIIISERAVREKRSHCIKILIIILVILVVTWSAVREAMEEPHHWLHEGLSFHCSEDWKFLFLIFFNF